MADHKLLDLYFTVDSEVIWFISSWRKVLLMVKWQNTLVEMRGRFSNKICMNGLRSTYLLYLVNKYSRIDVFSTIIRYEIVFLSWSMFWFWSWCFIIIDQYHSTTSYITRERSNWPHALFWCRCTTGKHTTEKPITKAVSTNNPIKATPIQSSKQGVGVDACARCRQGFFCSDHGEFVFTVILFLLNWLIPIYKC